MINEEFRDAAEAHIQISIYEHTMLTGSHQPQLQHLGPDLEPEHPLPVTASPSSPSCAALEVPMDQGQAGAEGWEPRDTETLAAGGQQTPNHGLATRKAEVAVCNSTVAMAGAPCTSHKQGT